MLTLRGAYTSNVTGVITPSPTLVSAELATAALTCPALSQARALADWVGSGQELTSSGVLRPATALEACRVLGISLPGKRLRSALDVDDLMRAWLVALEAGFVVSDSRRAWAVSGNAAVTDPELVLNTWVRVAAGLFGVPGDPCADCMIVLHELHAASRPLSMDELASVIAAEPDAGEPCPECGDMHDAADLPGPGSLLGLDGLDGLDEEDDLEHVAGMVTDLADFGAATISADRVRLTPLGSMLAAAIFEGGAPAPDADAKTLMAVAGELPPPIAMIMAKPWLRARSAEAAVRELLTFAEAASGNQRIAALELARALGSGPVTAWRGWAKQPGFGAYARQWLAEQGNPVAVKPADESWLIADALSIMLDSLGDTVPPFLLAAALHEQVGGDVAEILAVLRGSGHPAAGDIAAKLEGPGLTAVKIGRGRSDAACQLKISLRNVVEPPVWRRVIVPGDMTLGDLHHVIIQAMGWDDGHLHVFSTRLGEYGRPDADLGHGSEYAIELAEVLPKRGSKLLYTYDFGDDWEHDIQLEERRPATAGEKFPSCIAGEGACPPEDCGGPWGYANLKEVVTDPDDEGHEEMLDWLGLVSPGEFDPAAFSLSEVNARLGRLR